MGIVGSVNKVNNRSRIVSLDIAKFILSFFIVGIHTLGKYGLYPISRCAVPLFFMISSYLLWQRFDGKNDLNIIKKFIIRNLQLYIFWFVALLPFILVNGGYLQGNIVMNLIKLVGKFFVSSTFPASWYIVALIIGTLIVYFLRKYINRYIVFALCCISYILCCLCSNYFYLFEGTVVHTAYLLYPGTIYNSFPVSLLWIALGSFFATKERCVSPKRCGILTAVFVVLLFVEHLVTTKHEYVQDNDCYFMLVPLCCCIFVMLINWNLSCKWSAKMCNISTIVYCSHGVIAGLFKNKINPDCWYLYVLVFILTLLVSITVSFVILKLEKIKWLHWLRFSH
ncbi:MAG: acyltransferase [Ruminococcus sp.]|nr:acyltransferase [Ruminococcus sp.]